MQYYQIEDLIQAIEQFSAFVPTDERETAFEESGLGDMLNLLKEGVQDAAEEETADTPVGPEGASDVVDGPSVETPAVE